MFRRIVVPLAVLVAVALAAPASAGAVIRVNEGMFGVVLGQTQKRVKRKLGRPNEVERDRRLREVDWIYHRRRLVVAFRERTRRVTFLFTTNRRERTATGVGVGSTEPEVTAGVPGATCSTVRGRRWCGVARRGAATLFRFTAGTVDSVSMGT